MGILFKKLAAFVLVLIAAIWIVTVSADEKINYALQTDKQYVARIALHTPEEVQTVLERAEKLVGDSIGQQKFEPIAVVLHGPEVEIFRTKNYKLYKPIVDLAARLDAFNVVDIKVCELRMKAEGVAHGDLPAFVDTVPDGQAEVRRLEEDGYVYF